MRDTTYYCDFYADLFITHGGLLSKRVVAGLTKRSHLSPRQAKLWNTIKSHVLSAIHTSDEVSERQPVLATLFATLGMARSRSIVRTVGDMVLRDFVVEVKQPNFLSNSSVQTSSERLNDQQLIEALHSRGKKWGILTNAAEWQFFYLFDHGNFLGFPFISFSLIDMILHEDAAIGHIAFFVDLLTSRELRHFVIKETETFRQKATTAFAEELKRIIGQAQDLGLSEDRINNLIKLLFLITFILYCEDIGALPRNAMAYRKCDIRRAIRSRKKFPADVVKRALKAFAAQEWSERRVSESGNEEFWNDELERLLDSMGKLPDQAGFYLLWFTPEFEELDVSEISSSDLCDVYQYVIYKTEDNLGSFYTRPELSRFINFTLMSHCTKNLQPGDLILDPACGSGHLLKRTLFIADRLLKADPNKTRSEMIRNFCLNHLAGIDRSETAVFITKLNLWLSCVTRGASLPKLTRFVVADTLKKFAEAFQTEELATSRFLGELGSRVVAVLSNPPWKMAEGQGHGLEWLRTDEFWAERKEKINAQKINVALYFAYVNFHILAHDGVAIIILPRPFFVGTESTIRDTLAEHIISYAPFATNSLFAGVDKSQGYGIVALSRKRRDDSITVYIDLEKPKHTSFLLNEDIRWLPRIRSGAEFGYSTESLLPLFISEKDQDDFVDLLLQTKSGAYWHKGSQRGRIRTKEQLVEVPISNAPSTYFFVAPEGGGNSRNPLRPRSVDQHTFEGCNKDFHKLQLDAKKGVARRFFDFLNSEALNAVLRSIKGVRNLPTATLNLIGVPKTIGGFVEITDTEEESTRSRRTA